MTGQNSNYQATSVPYSADVLPAHDFQTPGWQLSWVREFGTNANADLGDAYNASAGADIAARINARLGMLEIEMDESQVPLAQWRGRTFEFPDWSNAVINTLTGLRYRTLVARILFDGFPAGNEEIGFCVGPSTLVGAAPAVLMHTAQLHRIPPVLPTITQLNAEWVNWLAGGAGAPTLETQCVEWGQQLYVRFQMTTNDKDSGINLWISHDGISWLQMGGGMSLVGALYRRCGLILRSPGAVEDEFLARLDWVRLYDMTLDNPQFSTTEAPSQVNAVTGGRIFV